MFQDWSDYFKFWFQHSNCNQCFQLYICPNCQATRIFTSNLKEKMAQRFFNLILLPRCNFLTLCLVLDVFNFSQSSYNVPTTSISKFKNHISRIRDDIDTYHRLNFHLYQALRKALFKPGAFFKVCKFFSPKEMYPN